jgi:hypothetical protein
LQALEKSNSTKGKFVSHQNLDENHSDAFHQLNPPLWHRGRRGGLELALVRM